jgi:hypothetical protein
VRRDALETAELGRTYMKLPMANLPSVGLPTEGFGRAEKIVVEAVQRLLR